MNKMRATVLSCLILAVSSQGLIASDEWYGRRNRMIAGGILCAASIGSLIYLQKKINDLSAQLTYAKGEQSTPVLSEKLIADLSKTIEKYKRYKKIAICASAATGTYFAFDGILGLVYGDNGSGGKKDNPMPEGVKIKVGEKYEIETKFINGNALMFINCIDANSKMSWGIGYDFNSPDKDAVKKAQDMCLRTLQSLVATAADVSVPDVINMFELSVNASKEKKGLGLVFIPEKCTEERLINEITEKKTDKPVIA
jgi:hypothetical protein